MDRSKRFSKYLHKGKENFTKHINEYKERNSDENRSKRIKSHRLELQEEQLKTRIRKTKSIRPSRIGSVMGGNQNPQAYGLGHPKKGPGSLGQQAGYGSYEGLGKIDGVGEFKGMDSLFGNTGIKRAERRVKRVKPHKPFSGMDDLFS